MWWALAGREQGTEHKEGADPSRGPVARLEQGAAAQLEQGGGGGGAAQEGGWISGTEEQRGGGADGDQELWPPAAGAWLEQELRRPAASGKRSRAGTLAGRGDLDRELIVRDWIANFRNVNVLCVKWFAGQNLFPLRQLFPDGGSIKLASFIMLSLLVRR